MTIWNNLKYLETLYYYHYHKVYASISESGREETLGCLLHYSLKFLFFSYSLAQQLWGLSLNFDWLVHEDEFPNESTTNCILQKGVIFRIINGDEHQFIGHCLIPLDLCRHILRLCM